MGQIVVGYDGSDCGKAALDRGAASWPRSLGDKVVRRLRLRAAGDLGRRDRRTRGGDRGVRREGDGRGEAAGRGRRGRGRGTSWSPKRAAEALVEVAEAARRADDRRRQLRRGAAEGGDPRLDAVQAAASGRAAGAGRSRPVGARWDPSPQSCRELDAHWGPPRPLAADVEADQLGDCGDEGR